MTPEDIPGDPRDILGDHLRDEMLDRQWEEQQANRIPTPESDEIIFESRIYSCREELEEKCKDLETRLTLTRAALKNILFIRPASLPPVDLDEARVIANKALNQTAPKP